MTDGSLVQLGLAAMCFGLFGLCYRLDNLIRRLDAKLAEHLALDPRYTDQKEKGNG